MNKKLLLIPLISLMLLSSCRESSEPEGAMAESTEQVATVERMSFRERVEVSGNIGPYRMRNLSFPSPGKISAIYVEEGDWVQKGSVMASLDTSADQYKIDEMNYQLETARYSESPRKIALMERELESLQNRLNEKTIVAPFDGLVAEINQREGEISSDSADTPLIRFIDKSKLKAEVFVDELDIARIQSGQTVIFRFDALKGESFEGRVESVASIGRINNQGLPVLEVHLLIDDPDPSIFIPYSFQAEILVSEAQDYLVVDKQACQWRDDKVFVRIQDRESEQGFREQAIQVRPWRDGKMIILDGLSEGDVLALYTGQSQSVPEMI